MSSVDGSRDARGNSTFWRLVGCSLLSGLLMQPLKTAGPDGVGELGPNLLIQAMTPRTFDGLSLFPA
jgi:hypothetical protein